MTRSYTIPRNFWRVVRRIQGHGTYTLCQLSYDVGQRVSIAPRNQAWNGLRFLFCMLYGRRPGAATNEGRLTLRFPAKRVTRIAPMCARGQEVSCTPQSTEKVADPPRRETKRSTSTTGQAQAPSRPHPAQESAGARPRPRAHEGPARRGTERPAADRGEVAIRVGAGAGICRARGRPPAEVVLQRAVSVHERVPAPGLRYLLPARGVPVSLPTDARLQRPPSAGVPLHRPPDPGGGKADRGERAEAVGDPPGHGHPRPRDPEVRGSDALDRRLPCGDDGGLEGPWRGRRLDAVVHHDAAQPAVRCVRALAVPPPQGRWVCADRQAPGHLVPEGPGTDRGPRSA